jgi:hypothetical protein
MVGSLSWPKHIEGKLDLSGLVSRYGFVSTACGSGGFGLRCPSSLTFRHYNLTTLELVSFLKNVVSQPPHRVSTTTLLGRNTTPLQLPVGGPSAPADVSRTNQECKWVRPSILRCSPASGKSWIRPRAGITPLRFTQTARNLMEAPPDNRDEYVRLKRLPPDLFETMVDWTTTELRRRAPTRR